MEATITSQRDNALFNRREVEFEIKLKGATPSRKMIKAALAQKLGVDAGLIVVERVRQAFGLSGVTGTANVYASEKEATAERKYRLARDAGEKGKPKEKKEKPKEEKPAPAGEKK
ncbi:MAG: hypothetical protein QXH27_05670 [Candidatus Micrarchaeia archaeon]